MRSRGLFVVWVGICAAILMLGHAPAEAQLADALKKAQSAFDAAQVSYGEILKVFFAVAHDPTQRDRQGPDVGPQYRSAIFYASDAQKDAAQAYIAQLETTHAFERSIVTQVAPLREFYPAEAYHQDYLAKHPGQPYIVVNDLPKLAALERSFPALYRSNR